MYVQLRSSRRREGPGWLEGKISPEARSYAFDGRASDLLEGGSVPGLVEALYVTARGRLLPQMGDLFLAHMG